MSINIPEAAVDVFSKYYTAPATGSALVSLFFQNIREADVSTKKRSDGDQQSLKGDQA